MHFCKNILLGSNESCKLLTSRKKTLFSYTRQLLNVIILPSTIKKNDQIRNQQMKFFSLPLRCHAVPLAELIFFVLFTVLLSHVSLSDISLS